MICSCDSVEDEAFPNISIKLGNSIENSQWFKYESKYYLREEKAGKCTILMKYHLWSSYWVLGIPFMRAYYSVYDYENE